KFFVPPIETTGIGSQQPLHAGDQISAGRFDNQMKMVRHQAPGMDLPAGFFTGLAQRLHKQPVGLLVLEDGVTPIPSAHDVVNRPGVLNAQFSRHDPMGTVFVPPVNTIILRTDPFKDREGRSFNRETDERTRKGGKTESWQDRIMGICEPKGMERRTEEPGLLTEGNEENEEKSKIEREFQTGNGQAQRASTGRRGKIIEGKMISGMGALNVRREA